MQQLDWLTENELRAYPLLDDSDKSLQQDGIAWTLVPDGKLPDNFLVDLQLIITDCSLQEQKQLSDNSIVVVPRPIALKKITKTSATSISVVFGTSVDDTRLDVATFAVSVTDDVKYPLYVRTSTGNLAVFGIGIKNILTQLTSNVPLVCDIPVEPATCVEFSGAWQGVSSISTSPEKSTEPSGYSPVLPLVSITEPVRLSGDVAFLPGYNFGVNISNNQIDLAIGAGYGLFMRCDTHFIDSGYRDCDELVSYINGVPPDSSGNFNLLEGANVRITTGDTITTFNDNIGEVPQAHETANAHTIFVGLTFQATDVCAPIKLKPSL